MSQSHLLASRTVSLVGRPLDFVGTFSNRWSYGIAFGATANKVMFLFSEGSQLLQIPQWAQGTRTACLIAAGSLATGILALRDSMPGVLSGERISSVSEPSVLLSLFLVRHQCLAHKVPKLVCGAFS